VQELTINQGGDMNSDNATNEQEMLRQQAEEQARLEDAIKWGAFGGEEPTTEQMEGTKKALGEGSYGLGYFGATNRRLLPQWRPQGDDKLDGGDEPCKQ
jgi:hypothetical protein